MLYPIQKLKVNTLRIICNMLLYNIEWDYKIRTQNYKNAQDNKYKHYFCVRYHSMGFHLTVLPVECSQISTYCFVYDLVNMLSTLSQHALQPNIQLFSLPNLTLFLKGYFFTMKTQRNSMLKENENYYTIFISLFKFPFISV